MSATGHQHRFERKVKFLLCPQLRTYCYLAANDVRGHSATFAKRVEQPSVSSTNQGDKEGE